MRKLTDFLPAVLVLGATLLALLAAPRLVRGVEYAQTSARIALARQSLSDDDILQRLDEAVKNVARVVEPSVVHIDVRVGDEGQWRLASSSGSGWIYDDRGHVVTNAHVIRSAERIRVQLSDGRLFEAESIGADPFTDIAVLRLPTNERVVPATRASGHVPGQGERVFAFGSPFGFKFSMSEGIISGLGREPQGAVALANGYTNFIQTDAAVNPGNSGGPLVDIHARVIGMNVAIATGQESEGTTEGQSAGISFAIPLPVIESVVDQLIVTGRVRRGFLGIGLSQFPEAHRNAGYNGFGMLVPNVVADGPADDAGLRPGDVITSINGQSVTGVGVLRSLISSTAPGREVTLSYWRDGSVAQAVVLLEEAPQEAVLDVGVLNELYRLGLELNNGATNQRDEPPEVTGVFRGSPAEELGFVAGQRIVRAGDQPVGSLAEFVEALADQGLLLGRSVRLSVRVFDSDADQSVERSIDLRLRR